MIFVKSFTQAYSSDSRNLPLKHATTFKPKYNFFYCFYSLYIKHTHKVKFYLIGNNFTTQGLLMNMMLVTNIISNYVTIMRAAEYVIYSLIISSGHIYDILIFFDNKSMFRRR